MSLKQKKKKSLYCLLFVFICILLVLFVSKLFPKSSKVEIQELYGDLIPYQEMSYGDSYVANKVFDSLLHIKNFEFTSGLAKDWEIEGAKIKVVLGTNSFKLPDKTIPVSATYIVDYYTNILMRLSESSLISNPGVQNLMSVFIDDSNNLVFEFNNEAPTNILALCEKVGYELEDGLWYGSLGKVIYNLPEITVDSVIYTSTGNTKKSMDGVSERITTMVLSNVLNEGTVKKNIIPNGSYGFITSGNGVVLTESDKRLIIKLLGNSNIRNNLTLPTDSVYASTFLYEKIDYEGLTSALQISKLQSKESIRVGVVELGSFNEIRDSISQTLQSLKIPAIVEDVDFKSLLSLDGYDLVYLRIQRGMSPNITGLFAEGNLLFAYSEDYSSDIELVNSSKTWDELCTNSGKLMTKLIKDGVLVFIDQGFDITATSK